jgi:AraC family transcriptional regulator
MPHNTAIERALAHIERHLTEELSVAELARAAGYSEFHFLRLFKAHMGETPAAYIRKRRISEAAAALANDRDQSIADVSFAWGFNSKENFTRAFKSVHHVLPSEYKSAGNSLKLTLKDQPGSDYVIDYELQQLPEIVIIAYPSDESFPPHFWNKYNVGGFSARLSGGKTVEDFGVCRWNDETARLDYWIGIRETDAAGDSSGTVRLVIPGGRYAVFTTPPATQADFVSIVHHTWAYIKREILPFAAPGFQLESYTEASRTFSEKIYIPMKTD